MIRAKIENIIFHYLGGKLYIEVQIPLEAVVNKAEINELAQTFQGAVADLENIAEGIFVVRLVNGKNVVSQKLVIRRN